MPVAELPGQRLRAVVERARHDLRNISPGDRKAIRAVYDDLRGALAHTASMGETCQVAAAVNAVRTAERCLESAAPAQAATALEEALRHLPAGPVLPGPRGTGSSF